MTARVTTVLQQAQLLTQTEQVALFAELCKGLMQGNSSSPVRVKDEQANLVAYLYAPSNRIAPHTWNESPEWLLELSRRASVPGSVVHADEVMDRFRVRQTSDN